jgi:chorismate mutase/prephenate dehydratase
LTIEIEVAYLLERLEKPIVAFLGPDATFSHQAALAYFSQESAVDFVPTSTIAEVFEAVLSNRVTYGIVPVENSIAGRVQQTMEKLYDTQVKLIGEIYIPIEHHLVARLGADRKQITSILSHKQALMQCDKWMKTNLPRVLPQETTSTARAAQIVSEGTDSSVGAIASELAAQKFGLAILDRAIQDASHNFTRFLVLGKQIGAPSGKDKTVLTFATKHESTIQCLFRSDELRC